MITIAEISDPIHGYFYLTSLEKDIVDSKEFQRLRRIRQLSSAYLTYPSAQHTRFEHSLGAMHLAGKVGLTLMNKGYINKDKIQLLRAAALLHDIGHGPFSHLFEEILALKGNVTHEDIGKRVIKERFKDILAKHGYTADEVSSLAFGEAKEQYLNEVISGGLSVDLMDYLLRDSYFTGAHYGRIDAERIVSSLEVYNNRLALDKAAFNSWESLLIARYQMFKAVYFHKTVRAAEVMLLKAMRLADPHMHLTDTDLDGYLRLTDDYLLVSLLNLPDAGKELMLARRFAEEYRDRRLLKPVFESIMQASSVLINRLTDVRYLSERAREIAVKAGVDEDMVYIDSAKAPSIPKAPGREEVKDLILISKDGTSRVIPMKDIPLISSILGFMNMVRVYTREEYRDRVRSAAYDILGSESDRWYERVSV